MTADSKPAESGERTEEPALKRVLGPKLLLLFIIGDMLGTGIYSLTGNVADEVGGAVWLPFACAFAVALLTASSYLELVSKYPRAAGAALYTHKAFGIHFLTFLVTFTVMSSGITSASTASRAFSVNSLTLFGVDAPGTAVVLVIALLFMGLVAAVNIRGVGESVKANVVLTCIELSGLLVVILVGAWALIGGDGDLSRAGDVDVSDGSVWTAVTSATALAFFALVGFEDSVNMAEETHDPSRTFPRVMFIGIGLVGIIYMLVGIIAVGVVPLDQLSEGDQPLLQVVQLAAPWFPIGVFALVTMFAVANSALLNMLMASRLLYGMSRAGVLPAWLGRVLPSRRTPWVAVLFTTAISVVLITVVTAASDSTLVSSLGGTTSLLLLVVFTVVHVSVLVLRRDPVEHHHFRTPTALPVIGAVLCAYLASPLVDRDPLQYQIAGVLLGVGVLLWFLTFSINRAIYGRRTYLRDTENLG